MNEVYPKLSARRQREIYIEKKAKRVSCSSPFSGSLPEWLDVDGKVNRSEKLTAKEQFIYDFDIADPEHSDKFRKGLLAVLREENQ